MTISVALCTYNGGKYLREQLDSLAAQTRHPDELVVCDDGSSDATPEILSVFAAGAPFPVHIWVNDRTLGSTRNFEKAIGLCQGDVIALCDQDDVWLPEKLARQEQVFRERPEVGLVFTDAEIVDEHLSPLGGRVWQYADFTPARQARVAAGQAFDVLLEHNVITGATLAYRASLHDVVLPFPQEMAVIHDAWIGLMGAAASTAACLSEPLIRYRQHPAQQIGARDHPAPATMLGRSHYAAHAAQLQAVIDRLLRLEDRPEAEASQSRLPHLRQWVSHLRTRSRLPRSRRERLPIVLREAVTGRYHRYSNGVRSIYRDLL